MAVVRTEMGAPGFLTNHRLVESLKTTLRRALGEDAYAAALQRGQRRSARDVLASLST